MSRCTCWVPIATLICLLLLNLGLAAEDDLAAAFEHPPDTARPWVYWMWMDGNLDRDGLTADLEAMQRAGLGGAIIMEVNVGIPRGPVKFMSAEWRQLFKHAVTEAERLGLQLTLNAGPGWTGSGGPWVTPEQSMQHLVASSIEVTGPKPFDEVLPRPQRRPAFFGDGALPPELEKAKNEFYRDVAVLAFPTPAVSHRIADLDEKALYVRAPYSSQPRVKACLPAPAGHPALPPGAAIERARVLDLSDRLSAEGRFTWDVPPGSWTILRFGRTSTGANTRPAPAPGLGLECDKFDKAALEAHFEHFVGALLRELGPARGTNAGWTSLHIDSWEMGAQNWTAAFRDAFQRRRGYDPLPGLPTLTGRVVESLEVSERFLWDLRQTAQELVIENHAQHLKTLGRRHGFTLSIEPYDMNPCADMSLGAVADVPMCEFWLYGFNTSFSVIEAASIAHTLSRPIVAAEAFTSTDAERWQAHPATMKALGDWAFCAGVNRIVFHRYQHQPWLDLRPGMTMGPYGVHWERTQTWWEMVSAYHTYLARCQFLLRRGLPVADVCFLVAEGAPHVFRPPPSATRGQPPDRLGYNFDGCAPETLLTRVSVKDGRLVLPDGMSYRVLVLPERDTMTPALLRKVKELVEAGATVIGPRPLKSPSLSGYPKCDEAVRQLADELWGRDEQNGGARAERGGAVLATLPGVTLPLLERAVGRGRILWQPKTGAVPAPEPPDPLARAKWIWFAEGRPASRAPVGRCGFRRAFIIEPGRTVAAARLAITADNAFEAWLNGQQVGAGDDFHQTYVRDVTALVKPGTNRLSILAENGGDAPNPAGLIAALTIRFADGDPLTMNTDGRWEATRSLPPDWPGVESAATHWTPAMELGPAGMAPWNRTGPPAAEPDQYGDFAIVAGVLERMGVPPDFAGPPTLRYTHRRDGEVDIYFVAHSQAAPVQADCTFRVAGRQPELWDPLTGVRRELGEFTVTDGRTTVPLRFEPAQSFFLLFRKPAPAVRAAGRNFRDLVRVAELAGPWEVSFDPKWGGPEKIVFPNLEDWSRRPEEGIRFYSGTATYRKTFALAESEISNLKSPIHLDLGRVAVMAAVKLNGRNLGVVWCAPWQVDATGAVQPGNNHLEITVANLWPNRLIGDEHLPPDCEYGRGGNLVRWPEWLLRGRPRPSPGRFTFATWRHYNKDSPLLPSGLLGPVTLQAQ